MEHNINSIKYQYIIFLKGSIILTSQIRKAKKILIIPYHTKLGQKVLLISIVTQINVSGII